MNVEFFDPRELLKRYVNPEELQAHFIQEYNYVMEQARKIVSSREQSRNAEFSIPEMFPYGLPNVASYVFMKCQRAMGDLRMDPSGSHSAEEMLDIINYAAFFVALVRVMEGKKINYDTSVDSTYSGVTPDRQEQTLPFGVKSSSGRPGLR